MRPTVSGLALIPLLACLLGAAESPATPAPSTTPAAAAPAATAVAAGEATPTPPAVPAAVPVSPWPMDIPIATGVITLYQPQPEKLDGDTLTGRAAASFLPTGKSEDERVFGALWMTVKLDIDHEDHVAKAREITITKVMTPKGERTGDDGAAAKKLIQDTIVAKGIEIDLDRLIATLEEPGGKDRTDLSTKAPAIIIRNDPAVLVVIDGDPIERRTGSFKRIVNTPAFLAIDSNGSYWLRGARDWLTAPSLKGPWSLPGDAGVDKEIADAAKSEKYPSGHLRMPDDQAPAVIIANTPTELVVFDGKPEFEPVGDGKLLVATNTDATVLTEVATSTHWLLIAGRWHSGKSLAADGTWTLATPDQLPAVFQQIPDEPKWDGIRSHIPGTPEANEALAQQQIPQTARVPRSNTITVAYDGEPKWIAVEGRTGVAYAENSADAVFLIPGPAYYVCRDAVWYTSKDPRGPFAVATSVPDGLKNLPASCPFSNVSYVQVYQSTPEYVWYGYTPGYIGWYSWYGCPVYGTGWYYRGWYGPICYPRPVTYGVGVAWSSNGGWGVAVAGGSRWSVGIAVGGGNGWYGPGGGNNINIDRSTNINIGNGSGNGSGNRPSNRPAVYDRVAGAEKPRLAEAGNRQRPTAATTPATNRGRENLAVDRDGNIGRPTQNGDWQVREGGAWKDRAPANTANRPETTPAARPQTKPAPTFQQTQQQRQRGEQRVQQRSAPAPSYNRGGGGRSGGGGGGGRGGGGRR